MTRTSRSALGTDPCTCDTRTVGVEEELLVVDPATRSVARAPARC